ncbi:MAG: hypothetical protein AABZ53_06785 [Planctomycetota bacterium]
MSTPLEPTPTPESGKEIAADRTASSAMVWAIGPAFLGVAVWLMGSTPGTQIPTTKPATIASADITPGPMRRPLSDAARANVNGTAHACSECHKLFTPSQGEKHALLQHKEIELKHGMNARCLNCHDGANRDMLVLHDGTLVTFGQTPRLCSQCHGTVYRDWQRGMHGKTMGSWDVRSGNQKRLACNECHDPHSPKYLPQRLLPGPNTLRMGEQDHADEPEERHTPLRRWSQPASEHPLPKEKDPADHADPLGDKERTP